MKRFVSLFLCLALVLSGCSDSRNPSSNQASDQASDGLKNENGELLPEYTGLDDPDLLNHLEDMVYIETVNGLNTDQYLVDNVEAVYVSKEYLEEAIYNSQSNIFFGYSLDELNSLFEGTRYVFSLSDSGTTTVEELETIQDERTGKILKNLAIGTGMILIKVTATAALGTTAAAGAGAAGIAAIIAVSALTPALMVMKSGALGGIVAGFKRGIETGDFGSALSDLAAQASESYKVAAFTSCFLGSGPLAKAANVLVKKGIKLHEAAKIQKDSILPPDIIAQFHNSKEYEIYKQAHLRPLIVNGKIALVPDIDPSYVDEDGLTNLQRLQNGTEPLETKTGAPFKIFSLGSEEDPTLAVLTQKQQQENSSIQAITLEESIGDRWKFRGSRKEFWKYLGNVLSQRQSPYSK